jgi:hypothetical protein
MARLFQMLKELKGSSSSSASHHLMNAGGDNNSIINSASSSSGPSSIFYVQSSLVEPDQEQESLLTQGRIATKVGAAAGEDHQQEDQNYEEPFDSTAQQTATPNKATNRSFRLVGDQPGQRASGASTSSGESFSEIFARHLRSRLSTTNNSKNNIDHHHQVRTYVSIVLFL